MPTGVQMVLADAGDGVEGAPAAVNTKVKFEDEWDMMVRHPASRLAPRARLELMVTASAARAPHPRRLS